MTQPAVPVVPVQSPKQMESAASASMEEAVPGQELTPSVANEETGPASPAPQVSEQGIKPEGSNLFTGTPAVLVTIGALVLIVVSVGLFFIIK